ncbi:protein LATERAL ROOT PRIMORDIUM 1 [Melia azedarach]|uniref:Protein LATERAL ROOT PRIMORDIUM 1 n=1 Tax=Melia azedarach TaxID=155640 RepID=A0ACC1YAI5_MELAZ|nr:protein LATERAL ROOT PRIMORDIUM 1 [Melia azedarach]
MLNLHNILLISPPQNHPPLPPPSNISSDHQTINNNNNSGSIHHQEYSSNNNDHNNSRSLHESSSFWSLKQYRESSKRDVEDDDCFTRACRDCGNRAKKECSFRRCRTCCKTRGYDCATHMRSTWVPAARRREKKLMSAVSGGGGGSSGSSCGVKRPRVLWPNVNASTSTPSPSTPINASASTALSFNTVPCHQEESFKKSLPGQVQAAANFRCIRVTAISDDEAEVGYVATVNISGHVFKGYLYDHGYDEKKLFPCISRMQTENDVSTARTRDSSSPVGDQSGYAASGN